MQSVIRAIEYHLPEKTVTTADLAAQFPEWAPEKIDGKTGVQVRHIAAPGECASDLAVVAADKLFNSGACRREEVDYLLLCTQSPDYYLPSTACLLQDRLGLSTSVGALDFNLGHSGFVYGLGLANGLISSGQASNVLLLMAETYSKYLNPRDRSVRTIFGDAAAATLVCANESENVGIGPFVYGTDGSGAPNLIVPAGGARCPRSVETAVEAEAEGGNVRSQNNLFMNGAEVFNFALDVVPLTINNLLQKGGLELADIDLFVFHQANKYILEHLRRRMRIPEEKFQITLSHCGNTVSATIPIALKHAASEGKLKEGMLTMLVAYGTGYSWAATLLRWSGAYSRTPSSSR